MRAFIRLCAYAQPAVTACSEQLPAKLQASSACSHSVCAVRKSMIWQSSCQGLRLSFPALYAGTHSPLLPLCAYGIRVRTSQLSGADKRCSFQKQALPALLLCKGAGQACHQAPLAHIAMVSALPLTGTCATLSQS